MKNLATRKKPEGNALASVVERFVTDAVKDAADRGVPVEKMIDEKLVKIQEFVGGYDFAVVLKAYWKGSEQNDETLKAAAIRWLRAEYSTKTEARQALGVRTIIDDDNVYESLKALGCFVRMAGYAGLMVMFDEMVNIYGLQNSQSRKQNYEQILRIVNDSLQGNTSGIGFVMCGTPEFLLDTRRGPLQLRSPPVPARGKQVCDRRTGRSLGPDHQVAESDARRICWSCCRTSVRCSPPGDPQKYLVPDVALTAFMDHCNKRIGEAYFRTPRTTVKAFVQLLAVLEQNPAAKWQDILGGIDIAPDNGNAADSEGGQTGANGADDELTSLRIGS